MKGNIEAFIPRFPHPIQQCFDRGDLGGIQEIKLNTRRMLQNGLDRTTGESYLKSAENAERLIIEEFLRTSIFVKDSKDS